MKLVRIENEPGLAKDLASKAVLSVDNSELFKYRAARDSRRRLEREHENIKAEMVSVQRDVSDIKLALAAILEKLQ